MEIKSWQVVFERERVAKQVRPCAQVMSTEAVSAITQRK
jgi:hypothetical protein